MGRLDAAFAQLRRAKRKALIPFVMGGDPSLAATRELLVAVQEAGADAIEVGIPFSDPLADGPVIQASAARALRRGATPAAVLGAIAAVSRRLRVPVVCLSYWNPIVQFGGPSAQGSPAAFLKAARASGVAGVVVPDLPVEEGESLRRTAKALGLASIFLAAPTSPADRLRAIARASSGFIYYVSVTGTTGVRRELPDGLVHGVRQLRLLTTKPVCVGFGISTPAQAARVARIADGVIVGSALVRAIHAARTPSAGVRAAHAFVRRMRRAI